MKQNKVPIKIQTEIQFVTCNSMWRPHTFLIEIWQTWVNKLSVENINILMKAHLTFHSSPTVLLIRNEQISKNNDDIKIQNFDKFWFFQNF